jgi:FlaA1/EpsC-like NDP-sugar epimerase
MKILPGIYEMLDGKVTVNDIREVKIEDLLGREEVKINLDEISKYLIDETVLVTGGGGSIGSELCRQIARFSPRKLIILDIYENSAYEIQNELNFLYPMLDLEVIIASVRDFERLRSIFLTYRPSVVFHAAAHKHVPLMENNPTEAIKNNIFGTFYTALCADEFGSEKFVLISTDKAVNPTNIMGATKRICEMIIQTLDRRSKTEYVAVRFGNVLGSNGSVIPLFKRQIEHGGPVTVTHKEVTRFFMTIPEAVRLVMQAGAIATGGEIFVLDMGEPVKIDDLARELIRLSGFVPDTDIEIKYSGLRPGEKLYEELLLKEEGLEATKHEGIFVAKPVYINYGQLMKWLDSLELVIKEPEKIKDVLSQIVPTYNSIEYKPVQDTKDESIDYIKLEAVNS